MEKGVIIYSISIITLIFILIFSHIASASVSEKAPEASSFSNVGGGSDASYTGDLGLNFPLSTIPGRNGFNLPLSLNYKSGIQIDDESTWVGLGWSLGIGAVTRSIKNYPDDSPEGSLSTNLGKDYSDQDTYYMSLPSGGGRIFAPDGYLNKNYWITQSWQPSKITPSYNADNQITKWEVIEPDGTKYIFDKAVKTRTTSKVSRRVKCDIIPGAHGRLYSNPTIPDVNDNDIVNVEYTYAWYLTEIRSHDFIDVNNDGPTNDDFGNWIKIEYTNDNTFYPYTYPHVVSGMIPYTNDFFGNQYPVQEPYTTYRNWVYNWRFFGATTEGGDAWFHYTKTTTEMQRVYLSKITTPTASADFFISDRNDMLADNLAKTKKLDYIQLKDMNGNQISKVVFNYDYSLVKGTEGDYNNGRLTLLNFQTLGKNNNPLPPTKFEYYINDLDNNEYKYYRENWDFWDFNNKGTGILPNGQHVINPINMGLNIVLCETGIWNAPNNLINQVITEQQHVPWGRTAMAWSLKKITYPTGGSITYNYEGDNYNYEQNTFLGSTFQGGGIRISSKTIDDGLENIYETTYNYTIGTTTSGVSTQLRNIFTLRPDWQQDISSELNIYVAYRSVNATLPGNYGSIETQYVTAYDYPDEIVDPPDPPGGVCTPIYSVINEAERGMVRSLINRDNLGNVKSSAVNTFNYELKDEYTESNTQPNSIDCSRDYKIRSYWVKQTQSDQTFDGVTTTALYEDFNSNNGIPQRTRQSNNLKEGSTETRISSTTFLFESQQWARDKNMLTLPLETRVYKNIVDPSQLKSWQGFEYLNFGTQTNPRYYLQKQKAWLDSPSTPGGIVGQIDDAEKIIAQEIVSYDNYGQPLWVKDAENKETKSYFGDNTNECNNSPTTFKNAFLTCLEQGPTTNYRTKSHYNNDGTISEVVDQNNQRTTFQYDEFNRLLSSKLPNEANPSIEYQYQYAESFRGQAPPGNPAEECNNGISEQCTNRVRTTTILNYRGYTPESQFKVAKYWDGLGRTHMNDIMVDPGVKHIRTFNEYNEIGQIKSTSDVYEEVRTSWIRPSPPETNILLEILYALKLIEKQDSKPIKAPDYFDESKFEDYGIKKPNNQKILGLERSPDPNPADPIDRSYVIFENSPLLRPIEAYPFDGDNNINDPQVTDPKVQTSYGSENIGSNRFRYTLVTDEESKQAKSFTDNFGNNIRIIEALGTSDEVTTDYSYDILGRVLTVISATGNPESQTTTNIYDTLGRLISSTNPDFGTITNTYFNNGNLKEKNHNGVITRYTYDDLNRIKSITYLPSGNVPTTGQINYYYDTYFGANNFIRDSSKCALVPYGDLDTTTFPKGKLVAVEKQGSEIKCFIYDGKGRIIKQIIRIFALTNPLYEIKYDYNLAGSVIRTIDPVNIATTYDYNNLNQLVETNINNYVLNPSFETNNNIEGPFNLPDQWQVQGDTNQQNNQDFYVLDYNSDGAGGYGPQDGNNNFRIKIKPNRNERGIYQQIPNLANGKPYILSFKFVRRGNIDANNIFKVLITDDTDNLIINPAPQYDRTNYALGQWYTVSIPFTARCINGNICSNTIKFYSTFQSNIVEFHLDSIKLEPGERATEFSFALNGYNYDQTINNVLYGNGVTTNYWYNPRKWVNVINVQGPQQNDLITRTYQYTNAGDIQTIYNGYNANSPGTFTGLNDLERFNYNNLHRLTSDQLDGDLGLGANVFLKYQYDKVGNRQLEKLTQPDGNTNIWLNNYVYTDPTSKNKLVTVDTNNPQDSDVTYTYDNRGNIITQTENSRLTKYTYDSTNMLVKIDNPDRSYSDYKYNADGLRVYKYDNNEQKATFYIYDINGNLIFEDYEYNICGNGPCQPGGSPFFLKGIPQQPTGQ